MGDKTVFQEALGRMATDMAGGAAIRHLVDLGMSAEQISHQLTYPFPIATIRTEYTKYLLEKKVIAFTIPKEEELIQYEYVCEMNELGKKSYRRKPKCAKEDIPKRDYIICPFVKDGHLIESEMEKLDKKDQDYLRSIVWEPGLQYHLMDERMQRILLQIDEVQLGEIGSEAN